MNITTNYEPKLNILGIPADRGRWLFIPFGMIILLCLGSVYSWSIFRTPLENELGISATQSLLPFTFVLVSFAVSMPIAGFYITRIGVRAMTVIGGLAVGLGYILSSFATHIGLLIFTYGVIAGIGIGIAYGVPMVVVSRWFPDKKGLALGLTIVGFGLSPLITAPLANSLIDAYTVRPTLRILGIAFTAIIFAIAFTLKLPPKDWHPQQHIVASQSSVVSTYSGNLLKSRSFYGLWICYAIGTIVGLSAIGISSPVGQEIIEINPTVAASSVALFALFNGASRPFFGWLSDRFKPHYIAILSYVLILIGCLLMVNAQTGQVATYLIAFCLFWFCLGGWLAMAPTITLRFFNPDQYAQNYGIVFTAYGVGALIGTLVTGRIRDLFGTYNYAFYFMAFLAIIGIVIAQVMLKRERN
ncbi:MULTISPECIES: OFA family MFS transporter [unclassified Roseofilum]|uniref:L-lactate MFS transporter n=1 Tax=unclassified Roseofilum TaxID=2620099 RepID=UPI001B040DC9|nr:MULTISPECIES: OFA family MFS transporter [unclassified Roseofilum]MBP0010939.1 OFA family MFS transporter [Roseofilum sp. Belize Diploria]MBP0033891.1 OFA family MFS transporter [Roseofilum sp. Belize BBD 4]